MPTHREFFKNVEEAVGSVSSTEQRFLILHGEADDYDADSVEAVEAAVGLIECLREARAAVPKAEQLSDSETGASLTDPRWELLRDINEAHRDIPQLTVRDLLAGEQGKPKTRRERGMPPSEFKPLVVSHILDLDVYPPSTRVEISVDSRVSQQALISELRQLWPKLVEKGWVRRTRELEERALELVRFVCLECTPEMSWRERQNAWDSQHPGWEYKDPRAFQSAFRRTADSLTGSRDGLDAFCKSEDPGKQIELLFHAYDKLRISVLAEVNRLRKESVSLSEIAERIGEVANGVDEDEIRQLLERECGQHGDGQE